MKINLKELRMKNNITIRGLSKISNVGAGTISKIENGGMVPSLTTICKLCIALNVGIEEMISLKDE